MPARRRRNKHNSPLWRILVEIFPDKEGTNGHFCAYLADSADVNYQPLPTALTSTSRKGIFIAVSNLCKRLDKQAGYTHPSLPAKWQAYLVTPKTVQGLTPLSPKGYLLVEAFSDEEPYIARMMSVPRFATADEEVEAMIEEGILNSYIESTGQTPLSALSNLCQKMHGYGFGDDINSVVLDSLAASFFFPVAYEQKGLEEETDDSFWDG